MNGIPLAPHELDQLPIASRVRATIEEAEQFVELGMQEEIDKLIEEGNELDRTVTDLYSELSDLIDALDSEDPEQIELCVFCAKKALERNA